MGRATYHQNTSDVSYYNQDRSVSHLGERTMKKKWILAVFFTIGVLSSIVVWDQHQRTPPQVEVHAHKQVLGISDPYTPWTHQWIQHGIPKVLASSKPAWLPWIVANPQDPQQTWWIWPVLIHGTMYFGQSQGKQIVWQPITASSHSMSSLPLPWRMMLSWTSNFIQRKAPPAHVSLSPSVSSWYQNQTPNALVAGFMMAMQTRPHTIVLGILVKSRTLGWIQLVSLWQWQGKWIPTYLIINPEPSFLTQGNLLMPPNKGLPLPLPSWAQS
ncbi:hypothetical protein SAMN00768000_1957 [Sulfobacillus thermosulfidooxidans DSM 9293]|uniref:Uncharacterized protein n=2 Tax=Sulfobacillus thermosulfidooxidans TaxID=28034 RepID=A0A1W1WFE1_SULTA|nr:hypothetical protein [Sulfobacillus thermosulfidooxidans]SMC04986.1 hypothetical protein SAMN00768000_1957 [Sulfobacillus thermosulfidooxidans DSM 9293]